MVEYPANAPPCAFGDFACSLGGANANVLPGDGCALSNIACGIEGVEGNEIARTFPDSLGPCSSAFGGPFADVSSATANVTAGAALLGPSSRLGCFFGLRRLGLAVLGKDALAAQCNGHAQDE
jgi:hypothetical protein